MEHPSPQAISALQAVSIDRDLRIAAVSLVDQVDPLITGNSELVLGRTIEQIWPELADASRQALAQGTEQLEQLAAPENGLEARFVRITPVRSALGVVLGLDLLFLQQAPALDQLPGQAALRQQGTLAASCAYAGLCGAEEAMALIDTLASHVSIGFALIDADFRYLRINAALAAMNGRSVEAHLGRRVRDVLPDLAPMVEPIFRRVLLTGETILDLEVIETRSQTEGEQRIWEASYFPVRRLNGQVIGVGIIANDVTAWRRAEAERSLLLERERTVRQNAERAMLRITQLQALTAALSESLTPDQMARRIMEHTRSVLGCSTTVRLLAADGVKLEILCSDLLPETVRTSIQKLVITDPVPGAVAAYERRPLFFGTRAELLEAFPAIQPRVEETNSEALVALPLLIERRLIGTLGMIFDTAQVFDAEAQAFILALSGQCAQALLRAQLYVQAQDAVRIRDSFIAVAAHDLRTPLAVLTGQAQILERRALTGRLDERIVESTHMIVQQASRINRMIGVLLDLTRIQTGRLVIERAELDLAALLQRVIAEIQPTLQNHVVVLVGAEQPVPLHGDEVRLEQVFHNLVGNAVKYSPAGGVILLKLERQAAQACIEVADRGIGIPAAALPRLFEGFYRAPNAVESSISGMGIGLYIVRQIINLHGGSVSVESVEGVGSTFRVCLPLDQ